MNGWLYLDNNATTRVDDRVVKAMIPYLTEKYANPSGLYEPALEVKDAIEEARELVANLVACRPDEVIFMGSGTEADNTALWSAIKCQPYRKHLVVSSCEHPAVGKVAEQLKEQGYEVSKALPNTQGVVTAEAVQRVLRPDTALVSVMAANNETGVLNPIDQIGQLVKANGSSYHVDATQAVGKVPIRFNASLADYLVFSGHKIHAPKGIGVMIVRKDACYQPLLLGGGQENKCRAGTENVPGIIGLGVASNLARQSLLLLQRDIEPLRDWLQSEIKKMMGAEVLILGELTPRTPNTLMIAIRNANSRRLQEYLNEKNIIVGTGSACSCLKKPTPSDTIISMGVPQEYQIGTLRISLSRYNAPLYGGGAEQVAPFLRALNLWFQAQGLGRDAF